MNCDLCGKTISPNEMVRIPLREMQQAVRDGFNPFKTPGIDMAASGALAPAFGISVEEMFHDWRQRVMADTTDWGLCPACAGAFRRWKTPTGERDYSALLESTLKSAESSPELAFKNFEKQVASDPDTADKFFWLGAACMACATVQKDPTYLDKAIGFFEKALEIDPKDKNAYAKLLGAYMSKRDNHGVRRTAMRWARVDPDLPEEARQWLSEEEAREAAPVAAEERVYPWRGISKMYRVALVLLALLWLCLFGRAMNVAAQDPIVFLIFAVIVWVTPARAIFEALRPTTVRELVISPERGLIFRRKSGEEKPIIAKINRATEPRRGKAIAIQGLSPEGKKVRAQITKGNLEEGQFERFKEDLQRLIPSAKITPVPTRALSWRRVFAGITALLGVLFLAGFLFTTAASVHDYVKGLEFEKIPFQTQAVIILALLAAFLLFAGLSVFLTQRRKIGLLFWSGLVVLGLIGGGYVLGYVWEGGLLRTALPSAPPTATPVSRFLTFEGDGFSFEYPSNWEVITEKEVDVLLDTSLKGMSPDGYDYIGGVYTGGVDGCRGCAHIVVVSLKDPNLTGTLTDEQYEQVKASYENTMGSRLISIKRTEVSGIPGVEVVNIGISKDTKLRGAIIVPPEPGIAYSLSCLSHKDSFDGFEAVFARAMESLQIRGVAPLAITPSPAAEVITYTVQAGDTLAKIAAEFGVTVEAIVEANGIEDPSLINVGQVLVIPQP